MTQKTPHVFVGILLSILLPLSACSTSSGTTASSLPPYKGPMPTVILDNTAPSNIDLDFLVKIIQPEPSRHASLIILAAFYYQKNSIVIFKHGEKFVCNGISLPMNSTSGYTTSHIPTPGTIMNCTYTSPQGQASFSFTIPEQPKILSPASGATIARSAQTPMVVSVIPICNLLGVDIGSSNGGGGVDGNGCAAQQIVNTSSMATGLGILGVNEGVASSNATTNPGFHAFIVSIYSEATIPVTWQ